MRRSRAASRGIEVDLSALAERPRLEILYAFQATWLDDGYPWEGTQRLQAVVDALAHTDAGSVLERAVVGRHNVAALYRRLRARVELLADPCWSVPWWAVTTWRRFTGGCVRGSSCWPTPSESSNGTSGGLACGARTPAARRSTTREVTQPWLRELVKQWNQQRLVSRSIGLLRLDVYVAIELSIVLRLRRDRGDDPSRLGRQDMVDFLVHLRARELRGEMSPGRHLHCVTRLRSMLRDARERGLHHPGGPSAGLAEAFALVDADAPRKPARDPEGEPERALPQTVIDQLLAPAAIAPAARERGRGGGVRDRAADAHWPPAAGDRPRPVPVS